MIFVTDLLVGSWLQPLNMIWKRFFPLLCHLILATTYSCEEYSDNMNNCWTRTGLEICYDLVFKFFEEMLITTYGFIKHPAYVSPKVLLVLLFPGCWGKNQQESRGAGGRSGNSHWRYLQILAPMPLLLKTHKEETFLPFHGTREMGGSALPGIPGSAIFSTGSSLKIFMCLTALQLNH